MPRGVYNRKASKTSNQPTNVTTIATIPEQAVKGAWWDKLSVDEKNAVQAEGQQLAIAMLNFGRSRLAIGEHLSKLKDILEPHNVFGKFLRNFHFSKRTAYRYIRGFENAKARLPEAVLKTAMVRGMAIIGESDTKPLGIYTEAAKQLPPPSNPTDQQAEAYLDSIETLRKKTKGTVSKPSIVDATVIPQDPDTLLKECYRFVSSRYKKLPSNHKTRTAFVTRLVGFMMNELGIGHAQNFQPMAIPEGFRAERGRPRESVAA